MFLRPSARYLFQELTVISENPNHGGRSTVQHFAWVVICRSSHKKLICSIRLRIFHNVGSCWQRSVIQQLFICPNMFRYLRLLQRLQPRVFHTAFLHDLIRHSLTPPKCSTPGGLKVHLIANLVASTFTLVSVKMEIVHKCLKGLPGLKTIVWQNRFLLTSPGHKTTYSSYSTWFVQRWINFEVNCIGAEANERTNHLLHSLADAFQPKTSQRNPLHNCLISMPFLPKFLLLGLGVTLEGSLFALIPYITTLQKTIFRKYINSKFFIPIFIDMKYL